MKRFILSILTFLVAFFVVQTLADSWSIPQEMSGLDLFQTDLELQALELQTGTNDAALKSLLLGGEGTQKATERALKNYQEARKNNLRVIATLADRTDRRDPAIANAIQQKLRNIQDRNQQLDLRIGILQTQLGQRTEAIATWETVTACQGDTISICVEATPTRWTMTARILQGLWSEPTAIFPDAEAQIRQTLDGWFRDRALEQLYQSQQRQESILELRDREQIAAVEAVSRLAIASSILIIGGILGIIVWLFLGVQRLFFADKSPFSPKSPPQAWTVTWPSETTWEVMILWSTGFIAISKILLPLTLQQLGIIPNESWSYRDQALAVLLPYVIYMAPMLPILAVSLKPFAPLAKPWFQIKFWPLTWLRDAILGYLAAVPLVFLVSLLSRQLLQGNGGGNPLLPILVESQDSIAKLILWSTVAIAAPFFEEILFRGFLMPSLTKIVPFWSAIAISGFLFAVAHLNLADLMPLTVLGTILGFVYARSGNLLAPMFLHALWNSGSFLALVALGGK
ncbi:CPBP family intramembrane glutamic endopeptidase [Pseudanabaena sp. PCC 6802]|uniref:CPBP family intramembrane glutamic endopeptidase n=1 Tax=Pseudanabaena sp. PCC 6802 TaxID=118173 RepID=UPI00034948A6|nr:type II CAAX endopeptidase family protein [Pseudanabaena sp. PCC 6802]